MQGFSSLQLPCVVLILTVHRPCLVSRMGDFVAASAGIQPVSGAAVFISPVQVPRYSVLYPVRICMHTGPARYILPMKSPYSRTVLRSTPFCTSRIATPSLVMAGVCAELWCSIQKRGVSCQLKTPSVGNRVCCDQRTRRALVVVVVDVVVFVFIYFVLSLSLGVDSLFPRLRDAVSLNVGTFSPSDTKSFPLLL